VRRFLRFLNDDVGVLAAGLVVVAVCALFAVRCSAQSITLTNQSAYPFEGWHRVTVDTEPPHQAGFISPCGRMDGPCCIQYVRGRAITADLWAVDVHCTLAPGQTRTFNLRGLAWPELASKPPERQSFREFSHPTAGLPEDPLAYYGDWPRINGVGMWPVGGFHDGVRVTSHWRLRVGRMFVVDVWLRTNGVGADYHPMESHGWMTGEALVTCSNPAVPNLVEDAPTMILTVGDAIVWPRGGQPWTLIANDPFLGDSQFGDGQARALPLFLVWTRHLTEPAHWLSAAAVWNHGYFEGISGRGVERLRIDGNPQLPPSFDGMAWLRSRVVPHLGDLHHWDSHGIVPRSGITGAQEFDQVLVRAECLTTPGAERIAYYGALNYANRPCHHREADGSPLDIARHPQLRFWDGRNHWHHGVSPDRLGKVEDLRAPDGWTGGDTSGWWGPDVEHWLMNSLAVAARLYDSPALQQELRAQATLYRLQQTTMPGSSTTSPFASRAIGYECMNAALLWNTLEDRTLAEQVAAHWRMRWELVLMPALRDVQWWPDGFGPQNRVSPWQQALGAYGLHVAGTVFDVPFAREIALRGARTVCAAMTQEQERWRAHDIIDLMSGQPVPGNDTFLYFGTPMAGWLCRNEERGGSVWSQLCAGASLTKQMQWMPR
jgi:hypothetical protein